MNNVFKTLNTCKEGLTDIEASNRLKQNGKNVLEKDKKIKENDNNDSNKKITDKEEKSKDSFLDEIKQEKADIQNLQNQHEELVLQVQYYQSVLDSPHL